MGRRTAEWRGKAGSPAILAFARSNTETIFKQLRAKVKGKTQHRAGSAQGDVPKRPLSKPPETRAHPDAWCLSNPGTLPSWLLSVFGNNWSLAERGRVRHPVMKETRPGKGCERRQTINRGVPRGQRDAQGGERHCHRLQHPHPRQLSVHAGLSQAPRGRMRQDPGALCPLLCSGDRLWPQPPGPHQEPGVPHICLARL